MSAGIAIASGIRWRRGGLVSTSERESSSSRQGSGWLGFDS